MNWMRPTDSFYGKYAPIFSKLFEVLYLCVTCAAPAVTVATGGATLSALTVYLNPEMSRQSVLTVFMVQNGSSLFGRQIDKFYYNIFYRTAVWRNSVERLILSEQGYREQMENVVKPYLDIRKSVLWSEREEGKKIYCERYLADSPKGVVMISHGFTETAEKYKEVVYYFVKKQYHVYLPEYCGHGRSYRLISDSSLIHVDDYQRYVNDFLYVAKMAAKENPGLPVFLYGHSMGGGLAAAEAAQEPELFKKVVLSSPMIRPATGNILWPVAKQIAFGACQQGKGAEYVVGQHPYEGRENFENSSSTCRVRFEYYQDKKEKEPLFQTNGASYSWLYQAGRLNRYLQRKAWKKIQAPVLIFQSAEDHLVSKPEQVRFVVKLARRGLTSGTMIIVPGTKHEIYGSESRILRGYWKRIFAFLEEPQVEKNSSGK